MHILDFTSVCKWKSYYQNSDFVPFSKFTFVTVWHEKFDSIMSEIGFWKRYSNFLHNVIHIQDSQKYMFCNIWNGILTVWPEVNFKSSTKYIFGYLISVKHYGESLDTTSRNQFLTWCCQTFDVTQWQSWICKTVQNHNSGCNFFIWKRIWNLQYAQDYVWYWGWF